MPSDSLDTISTAPETVNAAWCVFQPLWYAEAYPQVIDEVADTSPEALQEHYLTRGRRQGLSPNMYFDETWYLNRYPDVAEAVEAGRATSGFDHYCTVGFQTCSPHWLFDEETYRAGARDLTDATLRDYDCANGYDHYLKSGMRENRIGHLLFDPLFYREALLRSGAVTDDIGDQGAFIHFLRRVVLSGLDADTSLYFDAEWYLEAYPDVQTALDMREYCCPLHHYLANPTPEAFNPRLEFSETYYRGSLPAAMDAIGRGSVRSGYEHFLKKGVFNLRQPSPDVNLHQYMATNPRARTDIDRGECRDAFLHILRAGGLAAAKVSSIGHGFVDFFGYHGPSRGWLFCGWLHPYRPDQTEPPLLQATFSDGVVSGPALVSWHRRDDVGPDDVGFTFYISSHLRPRGVFQALAINCADVRWVLRPSERAPELHDEALGHAVKPIIARAEPTPARARLLTFINKRGYTGGNTLGELKDKVFLEIDEVIICSGDGDEPAGLILTGWLLAQRGAISGIQVQSATRSAPLRLDHAIPVDRPDVIASIGTAHGFSDQRCGFICYVADVVSDNETAWIEVETSRGETAFRGLPPGKLSGMAAIRFVLERFDVRYNELPPVMDHVIGPALRALNAARLKTRPAVTNLSFGAPPAAPVVSVVVPLYGRLDFLEYQLAFFSRHTPVIPIEYIYVLDDPGKRREAEILAASVHARFGIPFTLLALSANVGFAPANNIGLEVARGDYVCFANSDVFPGHDDWVERLVATLRADPRIGAVGPLLLFEDGSVQHQGISFEPLDEFGGWLFPLHDRKGWRPPQARGVHICTAITGAVMMLARQHAVQLGGFDEGFIIGDFEDCDLCLKLRQLGLRSAVNLDVEMYHLERQSQAASAQRWRMNLTLYNAWLHQQRWEQALLVLQADADAVLPTATPAAAEEPPVAADAKPPEASRRRARIRAT